MTRTATIFTVLRLVAAALNAAAYLIAARALTSVDFALAASTVAVVSVITGFTDFGTSTLITRALARQPILSSGARDAIALRQWMIAASLGVGALLGVSGLVSRHPAVMAIGVGLAAYGSAYLLEQASLAVLQAKGDFTLAGFLMVADKASCLLVLPLLLKVSAGLSLVLAQTVGASAAFLVSLLRRDVRSVCLGHVHGDPVQGARAGWPIALSGASVQALSLDVAIVAVAAGPAAASLIALPSRLSVPIGLLAASVSSVTLVKIASAKPNEPMPDPIRVGIMTMLATTVLLLPSIVWADRLVDWFLPSEYSGSVTPVRLMLISAALAAGSQPIGGALMGRHRERDLARTMVVVALIGLTICWVGATRWGATGGSLGRLGASGLALVALSWQYRSVESKLVAEQVAKQL
jgi:O-antigen/teichoic acid export membrane protein